MFLFSRDYNNYVKNVITGASKISNSFDYEKIVWQDFNNIESKLYDDLNKGDRDNDYIKYANVENLTRFVADLVKCGRNSYNYSSLIDKLNWFVGGGSRSLDGSVSSYSASASYGFGANPINGSVGASYSKQLIHFNPVEYIKNTLKIN